MSLVRPELFYRRNIGLLRISRALLCRPLVSTTRKQLSTRAYDSRTRQEPNYVYSPLQVVQLSIKDLKRLANLITVVRISTTLQNRIPENRPPRVKKIYSAIYSAVRGTRLIVRRTRSVRGLSTKCGKWKWPKK